MNADTLLASGIETINRLVECNTHEAAHSAIGILREHLDARYYQSRPEGSDMPCPYDLVEPDDGSDLL